jgi:pyridinium-3,5-biscarboxylic acid mononucleotide sulfurtransferase
MVEGAEDFLRGLGLRQARVRAHGMVARIEVLDHDVGKVLFNKDPIVRAFKELGFDYVALDLEGFRSGSMNEVLNGHPKNQR